MAEKTPSSPPPSPAPASHQDPAQLDSAEPPPAARTSPSPPRSPAARASPSPSPSVPTTAPDSFALENFPGRVVFSNRRRIAMKFANIYGDPREDDGIAAMFVDGSYATHEVQHKGAGSVVVWRIRPDDEDWVERGDTLRGDRWFSHDAEVFAVRLALETAMQLYGSDPSVYKIIIFTDAQSILTKIRELEPSCPPNWDIQHLKDILWMTKALISAGKRVELHWIPGHSEVKGNIQADMASQEYRPEKIANRMAARRKRKELAEEEGEEAAQEFQENRRAKKALKHDRQDAQEALKKTKLDEKSQT